MLKYSSLLKSIVLILWLLPKITLGYNLDSLYKAIDQMILNKEYYLSKKENKIDSLRKVFSKTSNINHRFNIMMQIYQEYSSYRNDSAISCVNYCISLADSMQRSDLKALCYCKIGLQNSVSGFYSEALSYLNNIPKNELKDSLLLFYYYAMNHLYGEMASYTHNYSLSRQYYQQSDMYSDSLKAIVPKDSEMYLGRIESKLYNAHNYSEALKINNQRLSLTTDSSRDFAKVAYFRAMDYGRLGNEYEQKYWLAQSALCDLKNIVMDQASLWSLAEILSQDGDLERSYRYVEYSWECTSRFSSHVRLWLVSPVLNMINNKYKAKLNTANQQLWILLAVAGVFALIMAGLYFYATKKRKQLAIAQNKLEATNNSLALQSNQLAKANYDLSQLNSQLSSLNAQLSESNKVKEEYIGKFFSLCSDYINKLEQNRILISRKMKAKQYNEILILSQNSQMKNDLLSELFYNFDSIFLHIFPNFIDGFNALLKPEFRYPIIELQKLPNDVRVFALIRLGIDDSSKIADYLHYSPNTIYNYRSRIKAKAIDSDNFELQVKNIGSI